MKKNWRSKLLFIGFLWLTISACSRSERAENNEYTCPMHLQIVQETPGVCPICGMDLVRHDMNDTAVQITKDLGYSLKPTNVSILSAIQTVTPVQRTMKIETKVKGMVTHNTEKLGAIASTVSGRIEHLFIRTDFQPVFKGQKIMEIYSPELITAERELLYLITSSSNDVSIKSARQKLILLGLSGDQVEAMIRSKKVSQSFPVYSSLAGYITKHADGNPGETPEQEMTSGITIREGMYVKAGQTLFTIVSHAELWAEFDVYQADISAIELGDTAVVNADNSYATMRATVDRVQPDFNEKTGLVKIRMRLINPHHQYHAGQLLTAMLTTKTDTAWWIPKTATMDLGSENIAFIKHDGTFRPLKIAVGRRTGDWLEVVKGVESGDSIAYNARFLVDSEDFIKLKINKQP